ncbi:MAG TPA: LiaF domain-containing protein [Ktedonobacterales bacterium]
MQNGTESPLVAAQRNAILQVRGRYERGELPIEAFRKALDALTAAQSPEECEAILRDLPPSPLAVLAALEPAPPAPITPSAPMPPALPRRSITAFMSETRKTKNGWTLAPNTHVRAIMGSVQLDLRRAQLPPEARMKINITMGEVKVIVPEDVAVTVMSRVWMGESHALGESVEGMVASGHEEYAPTQTAPRARLLIEVSVLMGSSHINLANQTPISISELVRDTLRLALENTRRSLEAGAPPTALPQPGAPRPASLPQSDVAQPRLPEAPAE